MFRDLLSPHRVTKSEMSTSHTAATWTKSVDISWSALNRCGWRIFLAKSYASYFRWFQSFYYMKHFLQIPYTYITVNTRTQIYENYHQLLLYLGAVFWTMSLKFYQNKNIYFCEFSPLFNHFWESRSHNILMIQSCCMPAEN